MRPKRVVHVLRPQDTFSCGTAVLNGMFGVPKRGKLVPSNFEAEILNAIPSNPANHFSRHQGFAISRSVGIEVDQDDRAVWSESDMTAAFYCFLEPSWSSFQAINKTVPGSLAAEFDSSLANEHVVYPALRVMPMGWQSACGLLQYFHRRLCFLPPPLGSGLDPSREIRRDMPLPQTMDKSRQHFVTVYLHGFSQAELVHISELASAAKVSKATAAVHAAWANWGIPRQLRKQVVKQHEIDVLGARVSGALGRISLPRTIVSQLIAMSSWFCQNEPRTIVQGQIVGKR